MDPEDLIHLAFFTGAVFMAGVLWAAFETGRTLGPRRDEDDDDQASDANYTPPGEQRPSDPWPPVHGVTCARNGDDSVTVTCDRR